MSPDYVERLIAEHENIILFDGVCNLCSAWVFFVHNRELALRLKFASVQSRQGAALLEWCGLPTDHFDTMVFIESGNAYYKSSAFLRIVPYLNFPWPLLKIGRIFPRFIRDWFYDLIANNRYHWFGKRKTCFMPDELLKSRFIQ